MANRTSEKNRWRPIAATLCIAVSIVVGLTRAGRERPVVWSLEHDDVWRRGVPSAPPALDPEQRSKIIELARNAISPWSPGRRPASNEEVVGRFLETLDGPVTIHGWRVVREEYGRYVVAFAYDVAPGQRRPCLALELDPKTGNVGSYSMLAGDRKDDIVMLWWDLLFTLMFVVVSYLYYYVFLFGFDRGTPRMPVRSIVMQRLAEPHVSRLFPRRFRSRRR